MITDTVTFILHGKQYELFYHDNHQVFIHNRLPDGHLVLKLQFNPSLDNSFYHIVTVKGAIKKTIGSFIQTGDNHWIRCHFDDGTKDYMTKGDIPDCFIEVFRFLLTFSKIP